MSNKRVFLVKEDDLLDLLICRLKIDCLNQDGVDNWPWYMESENEIIAEYLHVKNPEDFTFEDCAKKELKDYPIFSEEIKLAENNLQMIAGVPPLWRCSDKFYYSNKVSAIAHEIYLMERERDIV